MDQFLSWVYGQIVGFIGNFFAEMGSMGADLFELDWVASIVSFFHALGWSLFMVGLVVAVFEYGIEAQCGRGCLKDLALGAIKGFMAAGCFTVVPVELYKLAVELQASLTAGITGSGGSISEVGSNLVGQLGTDFVNAGTSGIFTGLTMTPNPIMILFIVVMMVYATVTCFFSNLKRGGILLIQICVGSLYLFSVPRGYADGFLQWCRQIIALCLTTFLRPPSWWLDCSPCSPTRYWAWV